MIAVRFTGLKQLRSRLENAPRDMIDEVSKAIGRSLSHAEAEIKRRTPVDTGNLRSSIGGAGGYHFVDGLRGELGTNVKYAFWVEVRKKPRHPVGEWGFTQKGAKAATPFIKKTIQGAMKNVARKIAKGI